MKQLHDGGSRLFGIENRILYNLSRPGMHKSARIMALIDGQAD